MSRLASHAARGAAGAGPPSGAAPHDAPDNAPDDAPATVLHVADGAGAVAEVLLRGPQAVIGRAQDARVKLDSGMVSRHHAELTRHASGGWMVRDLLSRNGTMVNGVAIASHPLGPGDRIGIGPYTLTIDPAGEPAAFDAPTCSRLLVSDLDAGRISTLRDVEAPRLSASHLTTLTSLSRDLLATADPAARLRRLCGLMVGRDFHGRRSYALRLSGGNPAEAPSPLCEPQQAEDALPPDPRGAAAVLGQPAPESSADPSAHISRGVLRAVRSKGEAVLAGNTGAGGDVQVSIPSSILPVAVIAVPLRRDDASLDLLYVTLPPEYGTGEWLALADLAAKQFQHAEDAWAARKQAEAHAAVELELERAHRIQMRLVPRDVRIPGLDLAIGFVPCRKVGGDYVDVVPMKDGRTLLVVADVCGKGLAAALIASCLHTVVHTGLDYGMGLAALMSSLNRYLCQTLGPDSFVTMVAVALDAGSGEFECVNAGHPPALLLCPGAGHRELQSAANMPLSCNGADPVGQAGRMEPGELLCLYTDGLTDLTDTAGRMLGTEGLCRRLKLIHASPAAAARDAADALTHQLNSLQGQGGSDDDRTFLLAKREDGREDGLDHGPLTNQ